MKCLWLSAQLHIEKHIQLKLWLRLHLLLQRPCSVSIDQKKTTKNDKIHKLMSIVVKWKPLQTFIFSSVMSGSETSLLYRHNFLKWNEFGMQKWKHVEKTVESCRRTMEQEKGLKLTETFEFFHLFWFFFPRKRE